MARTILITGASSGIGKATAELLASQGDNLVVVSRSKERLLFLQEQFPNISVEIVEADLSNPENVANVFDTLKEKQIKLDGMVYSAGESFLLPMKDVKYEQFVHLMNLNFISFEECLKRFVTKDFSNKGASAVVLSSLASKHANSGQSSYAASKAAINALVEASSKEIAKRRVRVNAVLPGFVETPMATDSFLYAGSDLNEIFTKTQPFGMIPPVQIAHLINFLLSDKASYITGALIPVGGGYPLIKTFEV